MQLSGEIAKVSLPNILQLVKTGAFTGKLSLVEGVKHAVILVKEGLPIHVELEGVSGVDPLYELFLWQSGTFSYTEEKVSEKRRSLPKESEDFSLQEMIKDAMLYKKQTALLQEMHITPKTILKQTGSAVSAAKMIEGSHNLGALDGKKSLYEALKDKGLSRREYVRTVANWLENGLAEFVEEEESQNKSEIDLPTWVVARLKQDNPDLTQSIIDMVIWVDRVKCWMYQADAEFYETRKDLAIISDALGDTEDKLNERPEDSGEEEGKNNLFAPPAPPPEPEESGVPDGTATLDSNFNSIFKSPTGASKLTPPGQFRLSSSIVDGAGGKLAFLQNNSQIGYSQIDELGLKNQSPDEKKDHKKKQNQSGEETT